MKRIYLLSLTVFAMGVLNAQHAPTFKKIPAELASQTVQIKGNPSTLQNQNKAPGDIIWQDNFDDLSLWTSSGLDANGNGWEITTLSTGWYFGGANAASLGLTGNFGALTCPEVSTPATGPQTLTHNSTIDLSGIPSPIFSFDQSGARFVTLQAVEVSTDGGNVWTEIGNNNDHAPLTSNSGALYTQPDNRQYTLAPAIAANPTNVNIRFKWDGAMNGANLNYIDYGWFVDNVIITEGHYENLVHESLYLGNIVQDYEYTKIPQAQAGMLTVQSALENLGANSPINTVANVTVSNAASVVIFTGIGGNLSGSLATGEQDTLTYVTNLDLATLPIGTYTIAVTITSDNTDEDLTNDTQIRTIEITDNIYSHFDSNALSLTPRNPGQPSFNQGDPYTEYEFGSIFDINTDNALQGINFYIATVAENVSSNTYQTTTDFEISIKIYEETIDFTSPTQIAQYSYNMTDFTIDAWNTISFSTPSINSISNGPTDLESGKKYRVTVYCPDNGILWGLGELADTDFSSIRNPNQNGWYALTSELALELNFDDALIPPIQTDVDSLLDMIATCSMDTLTPPTANSGTITGTTVTVFPIDMDSTITWTFDDGLGNTFTQTQNVIINPLDVSVTQNGKFLTSFTPDYSHQWVDCANGYSIISGQTSAYFIAPTNGTYAVMLAYGSCIDTSLCYDVTGLSINENNIENNIIAFPNPTNGEVAVNFGDTYTNVDLKITNALGQEIETYNFKNKSEIKLTINGTNGVYFIHIKADNENETSLKIIKK
jgi:hypothetical protein